MNVIKDHRPSVISTAVAVAIGLAGVALFVRLPRPDPVDPAAEPAAAVRSGSTAGPAARGPGIPPAPGATQNAPPDANPGAPTANLKKVADNLHLNFKSTTVVVTLPPGLRITNRVEVSTLFDEGAPNAQRITQTYDNGNGNRMLANVAEGNGNRQVKVITTLGETASTGTRVGTYAVRSTVNLEPLYDIALGPLAIYLIDDCDRFGSSEPIVYWEWPNFPAHGFVHRGDVSMYAGETKTINTFAVTYSAAGQSAKLSYPTFGLFEDDFLGPEGGPGGVYKTVEEEPHVPLLPGRTHKVKVDVQVKFGSHCRAKLSYDLTITLRQYPNL